MKKSIKIILIVFTVIFLIAYGAYEYMKPISVQIYNVSKGNIYVKVTETGNVKPINKSDVYPYLSGRINVLKIEEGQTVKKGDLLAILDTKQLELQKETILAQKQNAISLKSKALSEIQQGIEQQTIVVNEAYRQYQKAQTDYDRIKALYDTNSVSKTELEAAKSQLDFFKSTYNQQQKALNDLKNQNLESSETINYYDSTIETYNKSLDTLEYQLTKSNIYSEMDGIIELVNVKEGMYVTPQAPLLSIIDANNIKIEVLLLTEDVVNINKGMDVDLINELKSGDKRYKANINYIAPSATETVSSLGLIEQRVKIELSLIDKSIALLPGSSVKLEFITEKAEDSIYVPKTAIFKANDKDAVWMVVDGKAKLQYVKLGLKTSTDAVIIEGLNEGDKVIKNPDIVELSEGKRVG